MPWLVDVALSRRATRSWWVGFGAVILAGAALRGLAWWSLPTIVTADSDSYCRILHALEKGHTPDLGTRNMGYPLFMLACKSLPLSLNKALPLVQHLLALFANVVVMVWLRRNWGMLASLMTGALLSINAGHVIWSHYAQPNALLCSVVPLALIASMAWFVGRRWRYWVAALALWLVVVLTRDEVLLLSIAAPVVVFCVLPAWRRPARRWFAGIALIGVVATAARIGVNYQATGAMSHSAHSKEAIAWRVLHQDALVAPPRPPMLERFYLAGAEDTEITKAWRRGRHFHFEGLYRIGEQRLGMSRRETSSQLVACALACIRQRPGVYLGVVLRDAKRLWTNPASGLEWDAFRQSDPAAFQQDTSHIAWAKDAWAEFPTRYEGSAAQRLFHRLAVLRPGQFFAMKPLLACFLIGLFSLLLSVGAKSAGFRRCWFLGLAGGVVGMTVFYAAFADAVGRYRMMLDWLFFAVASLALVLPLCALRSRLARGCHGPAVTLGSHRHPTDRRNLSIPK